jgi:hypothetical protein
MQKNELHNFLELQFIDVSSLGFKWANFFSTRSRESCKNVNSNMRFCSKRGKEIRLNLRNSPANIFKKLA